MYKGTATLSTKDKAFNVDVSLKVWNFTIPKKPRLKSLFGLGVNRLYMYHHVNNANNTVKSLVYEKYLSSMSKHRISPMNGYQFSWPQTELANGELVYHYDKFIERLKETHSEDGYGFASEVLYINFNLIIQHCMYLRHLTFLCATNRSIYGMKRNIGDYAWGTPEHSRLFDQSNAYIQDLLKKNGLLDDMYIYWFDEPTEDDYNYVIDGNDAIKRGGPNLKVLLTEQVEEKLKGHVDAWCPVLSNYVKNDLVERQKLGDEAWTYICCCPNGKRISLFIDHPATELRLWIWHSFKNSVNGILLWETVYWSRNYSSYS